MAVAFGQGFGANVGGAADEMAPPETESPDANPSPDASPDASTAGPPSRGLEPCKGCPTGQGKGDIIVREVAVYDQLLLALENDNEPGTIYQLMGGISGIIDPIKRSDLGKAATRATTSGPWPWGKVTEDWVVYQPEAILAGAAMEVAHVQSGFVMDVVDEYAALPDAASFGHLSFSFRYWAMPLSTTAVEQLPTVVPPFVTDVYEFQVFTEVDGVKEESGALYRERFTDNAEVNWRDVWVLWDNYVFPDSDNHAVTSLTRRSIALRPVRTYIQSQPPQAQLLANMRSNVSPL